ncbi:MAG: methionyl-tRNA formyltransferase [Bacteroides sp.]|nr:methionyl-tRNA formyltransferase [Bacteroides sp.]
MTEKDLKIVFFGTPDFAVASLDALVKGGFNVAAAVTMPDKPAGRGKKIQMSDVKKYALEHDIPLLQPERLKAPEFVDALRAIDADLFIVIAFRMLPEVVWGMPRLGTFNLHASLLPKYRGAAPINHAVINGETETGITTFFLRHEIDTGDIITRRAIPIGEDDNAGTIHDRLMELGAEAVVDTVRAIIDGTLTTEPQPEGDFIPAPKIFKDTCRIDWTLPAERLHNFVRGLAPYPAAWTKMVEATGKPSDIKIFATSRHDIPDGLSLAPGEAAVMGKRLFAGTSTAPVEILRLQPAGKKAMPADAFILGYHPAKFQ